MDLPYQNSCSSWLLFPVLSINRIATSFEFCLFHGACLAGSHKKLLLFLDRFFAGEGPTAQRIVQAVLVSLCWAGFAREGVWCVLGSRGVWAGTAEAMPLHPCG